MLRRVLTGAGYFSSRCPFARGGTSSSRPLLVSSAVLNVPLPCREGAATRVGQDRSSLVLRLPHLINLI